MSARIRSWLVRGFVVGAAIGLAGALGLSICALSTFGPLVNLKELLFLVLEVVLIGFISGVVGTAIAAIGWALWRRL
jgi:hypothetical protein